MNARSAGRRTAIGTLLTGASMLGQPIQISYKLIQSNKIRSSAAIDSSVRSTAESLLNNANSSNHLPYTILVENMADLPIIAYTLVLTQVDATGNSSVHERLHTSLNVKPNGNQIDPKASRLVTPLISIPLQPITSTPVGPRASVGVSRNGGIDALTAKSVAAVVALDLVVFSNGLCFGPDERGLLYNISGQLDAERDVAALIGQQMRVHSSREELVSVLEKESLSEVGPREPGKRSYIHWYQFFRQMVSRRMLHAARTSHESLATVVEQIASREPIRFQR